MKILILSDDFPPKSYGGAGIVAFEQARELARRGHEVSVITTTSNKTEVGVITPEGMTVHRLYAYFHPRFRAYVSLYNVQTVGKVKKILSDIRPDIVHAHNVHNALSYHVLSLSRSYAPRVFVTAHDVMSFYYAKLFPKIVGEKDGVRAFDYRVSVSYQLRYFGLRFNPFRNSIIRRYLMKVDSVFAVSNALAEALRQNGIRNVKVMHNGIDVAAFSTSQEKIMEFKQVHGLEGKKVMFFGGRISRAKGSLVALEVLEEVSKTVPNACLLIAGRDDVYVRELVARAEELGLKDKVICLGWLERKDIATAYFASDVVLTLSLCFDSFPTANLEAMVAKKPVVGTCFGGTLEAIEDNVNGFIVNPHDSHAAALKTGVLLQDKNLASAFGQKGYERVLQEFSIKKRIDELEREYGTIISHG